MIMCVYIYIDSHCALQTGKNTQKASHVPSDGRLKRLSVSVLIQSPLSRVQRFDLALNAPLKHICVA